MSHSETIAWTPRAKASCTNLVLDPTTLRLFIAVCEEGTIARAAEREFIAASAISKRITDVEERIDTSLLHRRQRGVIPTAAGNVLLSQARVILRRLSELQTELGQYANGVGGQVRVVASSSAMAGFVPDALAMFLSSHERTSLDLQERSSNEVMRSVLDGSAELGICAAYGLLSILETHPVRNDRLVVLAHHSHPLAQRDTLTFVETLDHAHVEAPLDPSVLTAMRTAALAAGRQLHIRAKVPSFEAALQMTLDGAAVTVLPSAFSNRHAGMRGVKAIGLSDCWAAIEFVLCVRDLSALPPAARLLFEHLRARHALVAGFANSDAVHRE